MGQRSDLGHNVSMGRPDDIRLSFNEAAEIYDRIRPAYPADLFDALFQMLRSEPEIVEVGPETGQATKGRPWMTTGEQWAVSDTARRTIAIDGRGRFLHRHHGDSA